MTTSAPEELQAAIRQGHRFLLSSHANPDGDAIGSELGLALLLRKLGKGAVVWNQDETPALYQPLPGSDRIHVGPEPPAGFPEAFDAWIVLECPGPERTGLENHFSELPVINIDHHLGNQHYGKINWVDPAAPAVGQMVFRLAQAMRIPLDETVATALYLTLVTDTGGFRFSNATPSAFTSAAELVELGARPEKVSEWLYESQPLASMRLLGEMLRTLELHADGRVATALVTEEMYQAADATESDTEGLTDYPRSIAGVQAAALLRQRPEGRFKVSLRSRGETDVEQLARSHGGGGHRNAAGFEIEADAEEARRVVSEGLSAALT